MKCMQVNVILRWLISHLMQRSKIGTLLQIIAGTQQGTTPSGSSKPQETAVDAAMPAVPFFPR